MIYLLAKYTLLFLLTAALGFVLGYWFSRRNIEDVTESFEDLRKANQRSDELNWDRLWGQLSAMPEPKETDLTSVYERLDGVATVVSQLPKPEKPKDVNLQPLVDNLHKIENNIKALPVPEKPAPVDFSPVTGKIDALQAALRSIPRPEPQREVDLKPVDQRLRAIATELGAVDLKPIDRRLHAIETEIGSLGKRLAQPAKVERAPRREPREASRGSSRKEPRILSAALYGKKDNLRLISGVGPKLEDLLNKNGVYYFWQVAEWNDRDIDVIDERLDVFRGRIGRDNWVTQAQRLRAEPSAARMPTDI